jgi:hypothetical protein
MFHRHRRARRSLLCPNPQAPRQHHCACKLPRQAKPHRNLDPHSPSLSTLPMEARGICLTARTASIPQALMHHTAGKPRIHLPKPTGVTNLTRPTQQSRIPRTRCRMCRTQPTLRRAKSMMFYLVPFSRSLSLSLSLPAVAPLGHSCLASCGGTDYRATSQILGFR